MELKDLTRPLVVFKMEKFPFEFTLENIAKFDNDGDPDEVIEMVEREICSE